LNNVLVTNVHHTKNISKYLIPKPNVNQRQDFSVNTVQTQNQREARNQVSHVTKPVKLVTKVEKQIVPSVMMTHLNSWIPTLTDQVNVNVKRVVTTIIRLVNLVISPVENVKDHLSLNVPNVTVKRENSKKIQQVTKTEHVHQNQVISNVVKKNHVTVNQFVKLVLKKTNVLLVKMMMVKMVKIIEY